MKQVSDHRSVQIAAAPPGVRAVSTFFGKSRARSAMNVLGDPSFDLNLVCPSTAIGRLEMGLVLPGGVLASTVTDFGGNCGEPTTPPDPPGGCLGGPDSNLGATVDATRSTFRSEDAGRYRERDKTRGFCFWNIKFIEFRFFFRADMVFECC